MNLLMANGHADAWSYPLGMVIDEANFLEEREKARLATEATLLQLAVHSIISTKAAKQFTKMMKDMAVEAVPVTQQRGGEGGEES